MLSASQSGRNLSKECPKVASPRLLGSREASEDVKGKRASICLQRYLERFANAFRDEVNDLNFIFLFKVCPCNSSSSLPS